MAKGQRPPRGGKGDRPVGGARGDPRSPCAPPSTISTGSPGELGTQRPRLAGGMWRGGPGRRERPSGSQTTRVSVPHHGVGGEKDGRWRRARGGRGGRPSHCRSRDGGGGMRAGSGRAGDRCGGRRSSGRPGGPGGCRGLPQALRACPPPNPGPVLRISPLAKRVWAGSSPGS